MQPIFTAQTQREEPYLFNYPLVGTELHRCHHSADPAQARNYGAVVPFWDLLFGTYYYRPEQPPERLGVPSPAAYPADHQILRLMALPFVRQRSEWRAAKNRCRSRKE